MEGENELLLWETSQEQMSAVPLSGGLLMVEESEETGIVAVLSKHEVGLELTLIDLPGSSIYREVIRADTGYIRLIDNHLVVGTDTHLLRVDLVKE